MENQIATKANIASISSKICDGCVTVIIPSFTKWKNNKNCCFVPKSRHNKKTYFSFGVFSAKNAKKPPEIGGLMTSFALAYEVS